MNKVCSAGWKRNTSGRRLKKIVGLLLSHLGAVLLSGSAVAINTAVALGWWLNAISFVNIMFLFQRIATSFDVGLKQSFVILLNQLVNTDNLAVETKFFIYFNNDDCNSSFQLLTIKVLIE